MKKGIIGFILGGIIFGTIGVYATYEYQAGEVGYTPDNSDFKVDNVESAINYLYDKYQKDMELSLGETYGIGGYEWVAAEKIPGGYVMQSTGMTVGTWPGYKLTGNYDGSKSYGSANTAYTGNIDGDNIANYDSKTSSFYNDWKSVEQKTAYGNGLYLVSSTKLGVSEQSAHYSQGTGYYDAAMAATSLGNKYCWLGTVSPLSGYAFGVGYTSSVEHNWGQGNAALAIAPAFNLDASKVYLDGTTIKKKEN